MAFKNRVDYSRRVATWCGRHYVCCDFCCGWSGRWVGFTRFALQFCRGLLIAIFKPYRLGDLVETQGILGVVKDIDIFTTKMVTPQNKLAIVPNGPIANGNIINYTIEGKMRVDIVVGVSYDSDIKKSKEVLLSVLTSNPKVLEDPTPSINVLELADSSVNFAVRPFCKPEDYSEVYRYTGRMQTRPGRCRYRNSVPASGGNP